MVKQVGSIYYGTTIGSKGDTYYLIYNADTEEKWCSCKSYIYRGNCKHMNKFMEEVNNMAKTLGQVKSNATTTRRFPSSMKCMTRLFNGEPYNSGELFGVYAMANTGKSLWCFQEAMFFLSLGYRVFYIDTEGSAEEMMNKKMEVMDKRFGNINYDNLLLEDKFRNLPALMAYMGQYYRAVVKKSDSKSGKFESEYYPLLEDSRKNPLIDVVEPLLKSQYENLPKEIDKLQKQMDKFKTPEKKQEVEEEIAKLQKLYDEVKVEYETKRKEYKYFLEELQEFKPDFIFVDSITNPIRAYIPNAMQNYPEKSFVEGVLLSKFLDVQSKYKCGVAATFHGTTNVGNSYDTEIKIRGGMAVKHNIKRMVMIEQRKKKEVMAYRKIWLYRSEEQQEFGAVDFCKINNEGYIDLEEDWDTLAKLLMTDGDMKRLQQDE